MSANALSRSSRDALDDGHPLEFGYFLIPDADHVNAFLGGG